MGYAFDSGQRSMIRFYVDGVGSMGIRDISDIDDDYAYELYMTEDDANYVYFNDASEALNYLTDLVA